jgi:hypothetical protein
VPKQINGQTVEVTESIEVNQWEEIRLYVSEREVGRHRFNSQTTGTNNAPVEIAKAYKPNGDPCFFKGAIGEVRIWNTARSVETLGKPIQGNESGLVSWWRIEENEGLVTFDQKANNHAAITGATWINNPDRQASTFQIYVDGVYKLTQPIDELPYENAQFSLGGCGDSVLKGTLEETRIWKAARTQEQIQDNLFRRLLGEKADLIAYYQFDAEENDRLVDQSGNGNDLPLGGGIYRLSDAPIAYETPQVRNALAGIKTDFNGTISSSPAIQEYGDMQTDSNGELTGAMKRCYSYIKDGEWTLITGFKIGNIVTEWVGQAQYAPQIIGFIEGAPPVPSENLTAGPISPGDGDYSDVTSLKITESESVQYTYSASREASLDVGLGMALKSGAAVESDLLYVAAPFGIGVATSPVEPADIKIDYNGRASINTSNSWSSETSVGFSRNLTRDTSVSLGGTWEDPSTTLNKAMQRRFVPDNIGFAIVKSDTADIFALRLVDNDRDALIAYRYQPNPDIPKDWNIIPFKMNPRYVKQGTLDGAVGYDSNGAKVPDGDYGATIRTYGEYSYFKPQEAYNLKNRIEQITQQEKVYFDNFDTQPFDKEAAKTGALLGALAGGKGSGNVLGAGIGAGVGAAVGGAVGGLQNEKKLPRQLVQRNFVNTYVWTAEGGFFAESTNLSETQQETIGGTYNLAGTVEGGLSTEVSIFGVSVGFEMDASLGGSLNLTKTKSKTAEQSFGLEVSVNTPRNLQRYDANLNSFPDRVPGKVDAYRFLTFYLEGSTANFDVLVNQVIDQPWLAESSERNAIAIREAINAQSKAKKDSEKSLPWRVMHRVTYISRVPAKVTGASTLDLALRDADLSSNYELIKRLEPFVQDKTGNYQAFTAAVRTTVENYMPKLKGAMEDIVLHACQYFQVYE